MPSTDDAHCTSSRAESGVSWGCADGGRAVRRRGELLNEVIFQACLDELREHGYAALTMDRVAARAGASKATLYRRWPDKAELVATTMSRTCPVHAPPPDVGCLRTELLAVLRTGAEDLAGPTGAAARGLITEVVRYPELAERLREPIADPLIPATMEVLRRAVVRGEIPATALTPRIASVGNELSFLHFLLRGAPASEQVLVELVDNVMLPLLRGLGSPRNTAGAQRGAPDVDTDRA
ncbi:TetR/AcrR family transcriptional regulator [Pseudonocardia spinosispora]|uniref:TetR/AcrR family transcriptional regulator n=1 Tax=Pseudonocardia spinosispora TaxID=103441 RepID=UPI00042183AE|nr:TetR/AcrR family transcriptional regulator [Pseudonocardia spinosispora]